MEGQTKFANQISSAIKKATPKPNPKNTQVSQTLRSGTVIHKIEPKDQ